MADNLNYQQARRIRKTKFSDLYLDALSQKGTGVVGALGKVISLRTQAKTKGIKEKFDPLNIVKFLTFGSRLGPALFGKLTGRSQKDIDYFTGRARHVTGGNNTAERIKGTGLGDDQGMNEQLAKIFSFLKSSRDDDVRLREQAKNHEEEIDMEKNRRHKELVKTLEKLMRQINGTSTVVTAKKEEGPSLLDGILSSFRNMMNQIKELWDSLKEFGAIRNVIPWLARMAMNPAIIIPALVVGGIWYAIKKFKDNDEELKAAAAKGDIETIRQKLTNATGDETAMYANQDELVKNELRKANTPESLAALKKMEEGERPKTSQDKYDQFLADRGYYKSMGYKNLKGEMVPDDLKKAAEEYASGKTVKPGPSFVWPDQASATATPAKESAPSDQNLRPTMQNDPRLNPVPTPSSGNVSNLIDKNIELNLPNIPDIAGGSIKKIVNNLTSQNKERSGLRPSQISVRNDEPTYVDLINSTLRMI